ncbi:MAG: metallophosphoesterase [Verrucomicrobiaceae bacterium]|nr:metallophosphoesterase [Verrucomicrobiaceae bacterium]
MNHPARRRAFVKQGSLILAGLAAPHMPAAGTDAKPLLRVGLMTDLHYADKEPTKTRFYREALGKLDEAVDYFNQEKPAFVVELGDLIDKATTVDREIEWLGAIEKRYARLSMPRHYVLGNHCVTTLTKEEFTAHTGMSKTPHYAFDEAGVRFIVLDACYREDGVAYGRENFDWKDSAIPQSELDWLQAQLTSAKGPVVIFAHQRIDESAPHNLKNASAVRAVLEKSGKVLAVFQGHSHKNDYQQITGIHYCTLVAMVEGSGLENSGYTLLDVMPDHSLRLHGFRRQVDRELSVRR